MHFSLRPFLVRASAILAAVCLVAVSALGSSPRVVRAAVSTTPQQIAAFDADVLSFVKADDGTLYAGGAFAAVGGVAREGLAKFLPNGSLDTDWHVATDGVIYALALDSTGRLYVGGGFTTIGGVSKTNFARINTNGTVDTGYDTQTAGEVRDIKIDATGNAYIGGPFISVGGVAHKGVAKISTLGVVQWSLSTFTSSLGDGIVYGLELDPIDGGVVFGGYFDAVNGTPASSLAKVNASGTVVAYPGVTGAFPVVNDLAAASDGSMYIGGYFDHIGGTARQSLAHVEQDGTVDATWQADTDDASVGVITVDADDHLYVAGGFSTVDGASRTQLALVSASGLVDADWDPVPNGLPQGIYFADDGTLYVGGNFTAIDLTSVAYAAFFEDAGGGGGGASTRGGTVYNLFPKHFVDVNVNSVGKPLLPGDTVQIAWFAYGLTPYVNIDWSPDNGETWLPVAHNLEMWKPDYTWRVPHVSSQVPAARVRVQLTDGLTPTAFGVSRPFVIPPSIR